VRRKARRKARRSVTCVDDNAPFGALMNLRNDVLMLMSCWTFQATLAGSSELEVRGGRVGCWLSAGVASFMNIITVFTG
jgi:hypothetical protein